MSNTNNVDANVGGPSIAAAAAAPAPITGIDSSLSLSAPSPTFTISCSVGALIMGTSVTSARYNFRSHETVAQLLKLFQFVELTYVRATLIQAEIPVPDDQRPFEPRIVRHGIAPDGLDGNIGGLNVVANQPHLNTWVSDSANSVSTVTVYGRGGLPFPPGVQTEFRATQIRNNYAVYWLGCINPRIAEDPLVRLLLDFDVSVSGVGFGAYHLPE